MENAGKTPTALCNFTTFNMKQETKKKKKKKTTTKLAFKQRWPFLRIVRSEDRAANAAVVSAPAASPPRDVKPHEPSPSESNVGGDGRTTWVAFGDTGDEKQEEEEEEEGEESVIISKPPVERSTDAAESDAELEFASCYDDARSSFRPSSGCCSDLTFKIDEEGGLVREDSGAADVALGFDVAYHPSADEPCYSPPPPPPPPPSLKLIKRSSVASPLASFIAKTARDVGYSQHFVSMLLWMSFKRRVLAVAAAQVRSKAAKVNARIRKAVGGRIGIAGAGGAAVAVKAEEELWERRIAMGRRCRALRQDDSDGSSHGDDDRR